MTRDAITRFCLDEITSVASAIQDRGLAQRLLAYTVHIAHVDSQQRAERRKHPPTTRRKIDRLLDQIESEKTLEDVYWYINRLLSM